MTLKKPLFSLKSTKDELTAQSGLCLFGTYTDRLNIREVIDSAFPAPLSHNGYQASSFIYPLLLNLHGGGVRLEDIREIKSDTGLRKLLGITEVATSWAQGNWLRSHGKKEGLKNMSSINKEMISRALKNDNTKKYTLDIDTSEIVSEKREAQYTYKKNKGYMPIIGNLAENGLVIHGEFREGNVPPADKNYEFMKDCIDKMPSDKHIGAFRADSASYQASIVNYCEANDILFAIGGKLDSSAQEIISQIPDQHWLNYNNGHNDTDDQITETIHSMEETNKSFRLIVKRSLKDDDLLGKKYIYHVIISNRNDETPQTTLNWYHKRGETSENKIKELKIGFSMEKMPCKEFTANAIYFQIGILAYNLSFMFKNEILPEEFKNQQIASIRWRLYQIPGKIVMTARKLYLKVQNKHLELFQIILQKIQQLMPLQLSS